MNTQTRILRALEQKEVTRIGETMTRKVDVRIIAATNKDLEAEVKNGLFRLDLLFRLKIARIRLPSLKERCEDIPMLVDTFMGQARAMTGKKITEITQDAMQLLMDYAWPGNVRELKNTISFAAIHCKGPAISAKDLPPEITGAPARHSLRREYAVDTEKDRIMKALEACSGNRGEAAKMLGIGRATLYRRMKACMIKPSDLPRGAGWQQ
jgi:DNA-binding NtrC family response regulator